MAGSEGEAERLHSTVRLNQYTLQFEDSLLETVYQAGLHPRKKALWLRSLLPAAASQILFALADGLDFPVENLLVSVPTRVFIAMLQVAMWLLVRWDLVLAKEQTMLLVSVISGIPTLLLYTLQRSSLCHWDALFVTFGLSFYTIPKITPLGYVSSFYVSWTTAVVYPVLAFLGRPPLRKAEAVVGMFFLVPMVWVFNTIAYYSEYNSRERFALRRRLRRESITLAVACTSAQGDALLQGGEEDGWLLWHTLSLRGLVAVNRNSTTSFVVAVILWGAFTLGGWTSLPEAFKIVDEATGWAWFSHCAGVTVFLVVMTRRLRWLLVVPVAGAFVLWVMTLAMPASWIIVSAHSVGYGLLLASVVIAMGVFGWFICAWRELVSFLTRSCFLYPQLQAGMEREYPLLVRIVSEYTAGFDPEILSARVPTATAIESMGTPPADSSGYVPTTLKPVTSSLGRPTADKVHETTTRGQGTSEYLKHCTNGFSGIGTTGGFLATMDPLFKDERNVNPSEGCSHQKMVSVLPSFTPGKCFFCSKNDAEHFVPACGMWGKWTHWRMNQQYNLNNVSVASVSSGAAVAKRATMCTSYYDLQSDKLQLEARVQEEQQKVVALSQQVAACEERQATLSMENGRLTAELHANNETYAAELRRREANFNERLKVLQKEANRAVHDQKMQVKRSETALSTTLQKQLKASERRIQELKARAQTAEEHIATFRLKLQQGENHAIAWKAKAHERSQLQHWQHHAQTSASDHLTHGREGMPRDVVALRTVQPSGRLPYAQSLEIEGLRESSRHSKDHVDYLKRWRLIQVRNQEQLCDTLESQSR